MASASWLGWVGWVGFGLGWVGLGWFGLAWFGLGLGLVWCGSLLHVVVVACLANVINVFLLGRYGGVLQSLVLSRAPDRAPQSHSGLPLFGGAWESWGTVSEHWWFGFERHMGKTPLQKHQVGVR